MKHKFITYNPKLKELARRLRNNSTKSEIKLWNYLKGDKLLGYDFHRQKPIGNYICDFFCKELMLAIEVDGYSHTLEDVQKKDIEKQKYLESLNITILRFTDTEIFEQIDNVIRKIEHWVREHTPSPSQEVNLRTSLLEEGLREV
ncbi:MAG: DUF559 domain-containing protein [Bacteroidetes bacterium]|nr:DUF559 domain-containing protein [Bacteroidota bacterium]